MKKILATAVAVAFLGSAAYAGESDYTDVQNHVRDTYEFKSHDYKELREKDLDFQDDWLATWIVNRTAKDEADKLEMPKPHPDKRDPREYFNSVDLDGQ